MSQKKDLTRKRRKQNETQKTEMIRFDNFSIHPNSKAILLERERDKIIRMVFSQEFETILKKKKKRMQKREGLTKKKKETTRVSKSQENSTHFSPPKKS